jgi:hypothetical protein
MEKAKKAAKLPDGSGFMKVKVPAPAKPAVSAAKKQSAKGKLSTYPTALFEVGAPIKIKGDKAKRTWHITVVNGANYGVEFRHEHPSMSEQKYIAFADAVKA